MAALEAALEAGGAGRGARGRRNPFSGRCAAGGPGIHASLSLQFLSPCNMGMLQPAVSECYRMYSINGHMDGTSGSRGTAGLVQIKIG